eukprot:gene26479-biopygen16608
MVLPGRPPDRAKESLRAIRQLWQEAPRVSQFSMIPWYLKKCAPRLDDL